MELMECRTCGASSFTNGKCDYCRNQYEVNEDKIFYGNSTEDDSSSDEDITFKDTKTGKLLLKNHDLYFSFYCLVCSNCIYPAAIHNNNYFISGLCEFCLTIKKK